MAEMTRSANQGDFAGARKLQRRWMPLMQVNFVEAELAARPWFAGTEFTAADVMMSYPLEAGRSRAGISRETHPRIFGWVDTIQARPAYRAALARGGAYAFG